MEVRISKSEVQCLIYQLDLVRKTNSDPAKGNSWDNYGGRVLVRYAECTPSLDGGESFD